MRAKDKKILGIIPARGGSKGLPRKNVLDLGGKPLIAWSVEAAREAETITDFLVSTDDDEIADIARDHGAPVPFMRPDELASDEATSADVVLHALNAIEKSYDYFVLLQPTSPFRTAADIDGVVEQMLGSGVKSCVSVVEQDKPPTWMFWLEDTHLKPVLAEDEMPLRRQDARPVYALNGAVYVCESAYFKHHKAFITAGTSGYVMPKARSIDIDCEQDLEYANWLLNKEKG